MNPSIPVIRNSNPKSKPRVEDLVFGKYFTDHMFSATFSLGRGWHSEKITPYEPFLIEPGAAALHYGQALFEGMKAFRQIDGGCVLFRPEFNWNRLNDGAQRLCMQAPPKELMLDGIRQLARLEQEWIPAEKGASLYIRPTLIGTESFLGVRPAEEYKFFVICCPVGSYYSEGTAPIRIWIEDKFLRAAPGGLGATKAGANYAASLKAAWDAKQKGYAQVLWLDVTHQHVEEVGTMNVFFVFEDEIVTPALDGSILPGGVRDCVLTLLKSKDIKITERKLALKEVIDGHQSGRLKEVFGTGTAAVISPVGELGAGNFQLKIGNGQVGPISAMLYKQISAIQYGETSDPYGWTLKI